MLSSLGSQELVFGTGMINFHHVKLKVDDVFETPAEGNGATCRRSSLMRHT